MQVTREDLNPCTIKLSIVCDPEEVKAGFERAFKQITKKIKLPGFRPGHAPRPMLEQVIPTQEWNEEAAEQIVRSAIKRALEQQAIQPDVTTRQQVDLTLLDKESDRAEFSVKVPLPPKVELGEYKGLEMERVDIEISDEEVDKIIDDLRKRGQTREAVTDRGVEEGDVAVVNIKADENAVDGRNFMVIAGQTFPQLDEALVGMRAEEMKNLELPFPDGFQEADWAGKTLSCQITLNSLSSVRLPELDDTFAKSLKSESVDQLRTRVRDGIRYSKEQATRQIIHEQLLDRLMARSQVAVSDNMWEGLAMRRVEEQAREQAKQKKTLEAYAAENGMTVDGLVQAWRERAKLEVERALLIQGVFAKEKMQLSNTDLNQELMLMAREYGIEPEDMVKTLQQNEAIDELQFRALARKVGDFLYANASVQEPVAH